MPHGFKSTMSFAASKKKFLSAKPNSVPTDPGQIIDIKSLKTKISRSERIPHAGSYW